MDESCNLNPRTEISSWTQTTLRTSQSNSRFLFSDLNCSIRPFSNSPLDMDSPTYPDTHTKYLSVSTNPRPFSGLDIRHASSAPGSGTLRTESCTGLGAYFGLGSNGC